MQPHEMEAALAAAADLIRRTARRLARRGGFRPQDEDDLAQEIRARLLARLPAYDPQRLPLEGFLALVVRQVAHSLVRDRRVALRDDRAHASLDRAAHDTEEGSRDLADDVTERHRDARRGLARRDQQEQAELEIDVSTFLEALSPRERQMAEALMAAGNLAQAAAALGITRDTLRAALQRWRGRARRLALSDYLQNNSPLRGRTE